MILIILVGVALILAKKPNLLNLENLTTAIQGKGGLSSYPDRFREDHYERSFAGHSQFNVRLPHGPNPQQKYIQEQAFFDDETYQKEYKDHLNMMQIKNQDWRLDQTTNSQYNNYSKPHQPENNINQILLFSNRRQSKGLEYGDL